MVIRISLLLYFHYLHNRDSRISTSRILWKHERRGKCKYWIFRIFFKMFVLLQFSLTSLSFPMILATQQLQRKAFVTLTSNVMRGEEYKLLHVQQDSAFAVSVSWHSYGSVAHLICLVRSSGVGSEEMMGEKVVYFTNKEWPERGTTLEFATHSVRITDDDICQIRL